VCSRNPEQDHPFPASFQSSCQSAELIASANPKASVSNSETPNAEHRVRIVHTNTLSAAAELHRAGNKNGRLAILSMATPMRPGCGFLTGSSSQEEFLCIRAPLLPSLQEPLYLLRKRLWSTRLMYSFSAMQMVLVCPKLNPFMWTSLERACSGFRKLQMERMLIPWIRRWS